MIDLGPKIDGNDHAVLAHCLALNPEGWALEFGTGGGGTARLIAGQMPLITFDSFNGLPEFWRPGFEVGMFATTKIPSIENCTVVVGLLDDTLPAFDWPEGPIGLVHLDLDLYSSTVTALDYCGHLIQSGTLVVFDELHSYADDWAETGEARAWIEWCGKYGIGYVPLGHGREQWACRVTARMLG